jgi:hypothetical protein
MSLHKFSSLHERMGKVREEGGKYSRKGGKEGVS